MQLFHPWQEKVLRQIREILFHPATGLVYDYITSHDREKRFAHLPCTEEIRHSFPNPCGWGTGMEDCALNTGIMLALCSTAGWDEADFAHALANGLARCATVHGKRGFIVRGVLPADGTSCYPNSSRDQFTLAVYGMWSFLTSPDVTDEWRETAQRTLCKVADYCERTVSSENQFSLMRLDGGPAVVSGMWGEECWPHEMLRLPMIYAAAWLASGQERYHRLAAAMVGEGVERTLEADPGDSSWWDMPLLQMQCSLHFFKASGAFPELAAQIEDGMELACCVARHRLRKVLDEAEVFSGDWCELYDNWRFLPMRVREETVAIDGHSAMFGGLTYLNPVFRMEYARPNRLLRAIGNYLATLALASCLPDDAETVSARLCRLMSRIDLEHFSGGGTVPLLYGSFLFEKMIREATASKEMTQNVQV